MSTITPLIPRQPVPDLQVSLTDKSTWRLADRTPGNFTLVVFFRGLHCPVCGRYIRDLDSKVEAFAERGVEVIALSSDIEARALESEQAWRLQNIRLGHSLDLETARQWGLYVSRGKGKTSIGVEDPEIFSEPGVFLVRPDGTLYFGTVQTMPFARPNFSEMLQAIDFVLKNDYPARGEVTDLPVAL